MKKVFFLLFVAIAFNSCQKEIDDTIAPPGNNGNNPPGNNGDGDTINSIIGTWNFVSLDAKTQSISELDFLGTKSKSVTIFDYVTANNHGTLIIDDSVINVTGLTYTLSGNSKTYTYENGVLIDSLETPLGLTLPETNSSAKYKLVGADSIYFPEGSFVSVSGSNSTQSPSSGAKMSIAGNSLTFYQTFYLDTTQTISGLDYRLIQSGTATILLDKQ